MLLKGNRLVGIAGDDRAQFLAPNGWYLRTELPPHSVQRQGVTRVAFSDLRLRRSARGYGQAGCHVSCIDYGRTRRYDDLHEAIRGERVSLPPLNSLASIQQPVAHMQHDRFFENL